MSDVTKGPPWSIAAIWAVDDHHFAIRWNDGREDRFHLGALQACCPCAQCGGAKVQYSPLIEGTGAQVTASRLTNVGRYALKIQFNSGCCHGVYGFDFLRSAGQQLGGA